MGTTYLLVDGENIDATLGGSVLGRRPTSDERPRWDRVLEHAGGVWNENARGLFYLNATNNIPMTFVQALTAIGYRPVLLSGPPEVKVVDVAIQKTLRALVQRATDSVLLVSHDGDFTADVAALLASADRHVGIVGFREFINGSLMGLVHRGAEFFDLEFDVGAFTGSLNRVKVIDIDDFDPGPLLD
jgi:uncharacterized protein